MRLATFAFVTATLAVTLAGCDRKPEPPAAPPVAETPAPAPTPAPVIEGFSHQAGFDASGYYLTPTEVKVGNFRLTHMGIGAPSDFAQWETGDRASTFGPILFEFDDVTSPTQTNEMGGESRTVRVRVLPAAYGFAPDAIRFRGQDPRLGEVIFTGAFDPAALTRSRTEGSGPDPVLTGELRIGQAPARQVAFTYWAGD